MTCRRVNAIRSYENRTCTTHLTSRTFTACSHLTAWGARGREFESRRPDQYLRMMIDGLWTASWTPPFTKLHTTVPRCTHAWAASHQKKRGA
jgi:hypothetical protein